MIRRRMAQPELEFEKTPRGRSGHSRPRVRIFVMGLIGLFLCVIVVTLLAGVGRGDESQAALPTVTPTPPSLAALLAAAATERASTADATEIPTWVSDVAAAAQDAAAPVATATPLPAPTPDPFSATINVLANLRVGPGTHYSVVRYGEPGEVVTVVGASPDGEWYRLHDDLWVAASLVEVASGAQ